MSEQVVNEAYSGFVRCEEEREAVSEAWEAPILPLNYARSLFPNCTCELPVGPGVRFIHVTLQRVGSLQFDRHTP
jgi:hypothetical protein